MLGTTTLDQMTEQELEDYLDYLYAEYQAREDAYRFEDNYKPFETKETPCASNNNKSTYSEQGRG